MMKFSKIVLSIVLVSMLLGGSVIAAEESAAAVGIAGKPADAKYPFVAEVTASNVFIRAGNSTTWYHISKVQKGARVTVVDETPAWAKILPPAGSYSWIHKNYVKVDSAKPTDGEVTGDDVRVWAGSDYMEPLRSNREQTRLNTGDIVELFPEQPETGDYYKIKPPAGAHLWISAEYLRYVGTPEQTKPIVIPPRPTGNETPAVTGTKEPKDLKFTNLEDKTNKVEPEKKPTEPTETPEKAPVKPTMTALEIEYTQKCHELSTQIEAELKKPLDKQNYAPIRKALDVISKKPEVGKASTYAKILTERIDRIELALSIPKQLQQQDALLQQARENIAKAHQAKLKSMPKEMKYLYVGLLRPSHVYTDKAGQKRYILIDDSGKISCYLEAANSSVAAKLENLVDSPVGIRGNIASDEKSLVTVVSATVVEAITK